MSNKFVATLQNYRWYEDGTEAASTALELENISHDRTITADSQVQLRVMIEETGSGSVDGATTDDWTIEYRKNGGGSWVPVTTATSNVKIDTGASLTDAAATTNRASNGVSDGSGSFVAGEQVGGSGADGEVTDFQLTANNFTEFVFGLVLVNADLADSDSLTFRIALNGSNITSTNTPTITITKLTPIVIDGSQTPDLDPDPLVTTGAAPTLAYSWTVRPTTGALALRADLQRRQHGFRLGYRPCFCWFCARSRRRWW
jgi:hypothetical protein